MRRENIAKNCLQLSKSANHDLQLPWAGYVRWIKIWCVKLNAQNDGNHFVWKQSLPIIAMIHEKKCLSLLPHLWIYKWITPDHACECAVQMGGDALIIKSWRIHTWQCWQPSSAARKPSVRQSSVWRQAGYNQAVQWRRDLFELSPVSREAFKDQFGDKGWPGLRCVDEGY